MQCRQAVSLPLTAGVTFQVGQESGTRQGGAKQGVGLAMTFTVGSYCQRRGKETKETGRDGTVEHITCLQKISG